MKNDKLYTVNRWNRRMLDGSYPSSSSYYSHPSYNRLIGQDGHRYEGGGWTDLYKGWNDYTLPSFNIVPYDNSGSGITEAVHSIANATSLPEIGKIPSVKTPSISLGNKIGTLAKTSAGSIGLGIAGGLANKFAYKGLSGGLQSGAGEAIANIGNTVGGLVSNIPGVGTLAGPIIQAATGIIGGGISRAFGNKMNKENIANVENNIRGMRSSANALAGSNDNASLIENFANTNMGYNFGNSYIGKDGWFSSKAKKKANNLRNQQNVARDVVGHELADASEAVTLNRRDNLLAHSAAFGGPIEMMANNDNMGAIGYGLMSDYLTMRNNQTQNKGNMISYLGNMPSEPLTYGDGGGIHIKKSHEGRLTELKKRTGKTEAELWAEGNPSVRKMITFARNARKWHGDGGLLDSSSSLNSYSSPYSLIGNNDTLFAIGGDLQANGGDYSTGLTHVDEGGRHEENPYDGVQFGVAEDGEPNLVEEGETVFNDFVFSDRIRPTKEVLRKFHIYSKGGKMTYADVSKRLEKEAQERSNDAISQAALKKMLEQLAEAQEEQKAEEEAKRAKEAFEALSPEEQQQVLAQIAAQQQAATEQQPTEQMAGEDAAAMQQPTQQEDMPIEQNGQETQGYAEGGKIGHKYPIGGDMIRNAILNAIRLKNGQRVYGQDQFNDWAKENDVTGFDYNGDWTQALKNDSLKAVLTKASPELAYAIANGYGTPYDASTNPILNTDQTKGNWVSYMPAAWKDSQDAFMRELNWDTINGMTNKQFADAVRATNAYKKTTEWLKDANNAKQYFNALLKDENTPEKAKNWINTNVFDGDGNWRNGKFDYDTMLKPVREDDYVGSFWKSAVPATIPDVNKNLLVGKDGAISVIDTDDLTGLTQVGNPYKWTDDKGNNTYTFYKMADNNNATKPDEDEEPVNKLPYRKYGDLFQLAGVAGPAIGLASWLAGVGKPDTSGLDAAVESVGSPSLASYQPVGSYLTYRPMDIWAQQNQNRADAMGMARALGNSNSPTRNASLVALANNTINNNGNLLRQAQEYNNSLAQQVANYNRGTDIQNANAFNQMSQFNADARNKNRQYRASLLAQNESQKLGARSAWDNAWYGNVGNVANALSNYGRHIDEDNLLRALVNSGAIGGVNDELGIMAGVRNGRKSAAKGGKLKKRKGLTF